jgi:hypothetical protein
VTGCIFRFRLCRLRPREEGNLDLLAAGEAHCRRGSGPADPQRPQLQPGWTPHAAMTHSATLPHSVPVIGDSTCHLPPPPPGTSRKAIRKSLPWALTTAMKDRKRNFLTIKRPALRGHGSPMLLTKSFIPQAKSNTISV